MSKVQTCFLLILSVVWAAVASPATQAQNAEPGRSLRGLLVPRAEATLSSQISAVIADIPVRAGERFKRGDTLVRFDCAIQRGQLKKSEAELNAAKRSLEVKRELAKLASVSGLELELAEAEAAKAEADVAIAQAVVTLCVVKAPYDGRVTELKARSHESAQAGQKLMDILDDGILEIEVIVPSRWLEWLRPGAPFALKIDETGKSYSGQVSKLGSRVDPVSQSVKIYGTLKNSASELLAGMSGEVAFQGRP